MHLEAGLRDDSLHKPFPEDIYRSLVSAIADPYLARSLRPRQHLLEECIAPYSGTCNKSTAIDQLPMPNRRHKGKALDLLVDIHRRKRLGNPTHRLAHRLHKLTEQSAHIALTSLPNLRWADRAQAPLSDLRWLPLISPAQWIHTTSITKLVLNGSGGTCEEPPYLGMPLLMFRQATERPEPSLSRHTLPLPCDSADMTSTIISALRCAAQKPYIPDLHDFIPLHMTVAVPLQRQPPFIEDFLHVAKIATTHNAADTHKLDKIY